MDECLVPYMKKVRDEMKAWHIPCLDCWKVHLHQDFFGYICNRLSLEEAEFKGVEGAAAQPVRPGVATAPPGVATDEEDSDLIDEDDARELTDQDLYSVRVPWLHSEICRTSMTQPCDAHGQKTVKDGACIAFR